MCDMRNEYDSSAARKNPYAAQIKKQITVRLDEESTYFRRLNPANWVEREALRGFAVI